MNYEYMYLGSSPCDESCAQVDDEDYSQKAYKECLAFKRQLIRIIAAGHSNFNDMFESDIDFKITIKSEPHDFGIYKEVAIKFNTENEKAVDLAYWLEERAPLNWDEQAKKELNGEL